ncbi:MAG TPA: HD domain-containing protein [Pseudonocardiaceae bacterium]|nr:HD domain-containing protein [Pseudonocardiaceae bacterium]
MADQSPAWAREIAQRVLADALPDRWVHTQGVAAQARAIGPVLGWDTDLIEVAAWLHDIGYAPALAVTGFHPLDGARYLRDREGAVPAVCALVAHHSGAVVEAAERGLSEPLLVEFPLNGHFGEQIIAITYCDFTTGPRGERLSPEQRITEILSRYEPDSPVHRAVQASAPRLLDQCREVLAALRASERA